MSKGEGLPKGWVAPTIGEISSLLSGFGFPERLQGKADGVIPFFKVGDISEAWKGGRTYLIKAKHYISDDEANSIRAKPLPAGTVVFAKIGAAISLNRRSILGQSSLVDNNVMGIWTEPKHVDQKYLFHYACTLRFGESSRASIVPSIRKSDVEYIRFPLPPVSEQRRIVAKIEELFSDLDAGVAALQRVKAKLKRYRASVLKAAVEGKLTAEWRKKNRAKETGQQLLDRILVERRRKWEAEQLAGFEKAGKKPSAGWKEKYKEPTGPDGSGLPELPDEWCWASVEQLLVEGSCNGISVKGSNTPPGVPALRLSAMGDTGFDYSVRRYIPISDDVAQSLAIKEGDFFVARGNGSLHLVGRGTLAQSPAEQIVFPDTMIRLRLLDPVAIRKYLAAVWPSRLVRGQIEKRARTTAGIYKISQRDIDRFVVPFPPLAEQVHIVAEVERCVSIIQESELQIHANLKRSARLRQSILKRAFEGKLVPQDPNDEPASVLLDRIKAGSNNTPGRTSTAAQTRLKRRSSIHPSNNRRRKHDYRNA